MNHYDFTLTLVLNPVSGLKIRQKVRATDIYSAKAKIMPWLLKMAAGWGVADGVGCILDIKLSKDNPENAIKDEFIRNLMKEIHEAHQAGQCEQ